MENVHRMKLCHNLAERILNLFMLNSTSHKD